MKQFTTGLILSLSLFFLFSCQKDISVENNTPGVITSDSFYIDKIVEIDSLNRDSSALYFDYDNLKRVTLIRFWEQGFPVDTAYSFYYTGSQALPFKTIHYPYSDEIYHFYNAQNKLVSDSTSNPADTGHIIYNTRTYNTYDYTYTADKIFIKTVSHFYDASTNTSQVVTTIDTSRTDANKNLLFTRLNAYGETSNITYNNKPNPFAKLNVFPSFRPYDHFEGDEFIQSPDLWTSVYQTSLQFGGSTFIVDAKQFNITYNTNNYPTSSVISVNHDAVNPAPYYWKRYFFYKKL